MSRAQRDKGKAGERELAALLTEITGHDVRRKVRQHDGDHDLDLPGWAVECKRHKAAGRAEIGAWWRQTVAQATQAAPVLFYRLDRGNWRAVWAPDGDPAHPVEADPATWWRLLQRVLICRIPPGGNLMPDVATVNGE